jgi:hypothetical protein
MFGAGTTSQFTPGSQLGGGMTGGLMSGQAGGLVVSPTSQTVKPQLLALANSPYGSSPLFKNIMDVSLIYR